jgi:hypothetical protein
MKVKFYSCGGKKNILKWINYLFIENNMIINSIVLIILKYGIKIIILKYGIKIINLIKNYGCQNSL